MNFCSVAFVFALFATFSLAACSVSSDPTKAVATNKRIGSGASARPVKLADLSIEVTEEALNAPQSDFFFNAHGHFGDKTQFNSRLADEAKAGYTVHCVKHSAIGIEVNYPPEGIVKSKAEKVLKGLLGASKPALIEADGDDLIDPSCPQACEYFYFENGLRGEFFYVPGSKSRIVQINLWRG